MAVRTLYLLTLEPGGWGLSTRKMVIEQANHNVFKTTDGAETVKLAGMFPFDALIMDTHCDDMDPVEIANAVRQKDPKLRIIAISKDGDCPPALRDVVDLYLPAWEPATCIRAMEVFLNVAS
jgi:CheY-like chemotaxis protein